MHRLTLLVHFGAETSRWVNKVASPLAQKGGIESAGRIHRSNADDNGPLKRGRVRPDDGQGPREQVKQVLDGRLDGREKAPAIALDFLYSLLAPTKT